MESVEFDGKIFKKIITSSQIQQRVAEMAAEIQHDYKGRHPFYVCMLSGAAIFTADLMRAMDVTDYIGFVKCTSYVGTSRSELLDFTMPLTIDVKDRDVIILEDLIDSGHTMYEFKKMVLNSGASSCKIAVLVKKPSNLLYDVKADYVGFTLSSGFIVGNGFDVDGYGRGLKDIYQEI